MQQAKADRQNLLSEDDGAFLQELENKVQPQPPRKRRVWFSAAAVGAAGVTSAIVCFAVFYPSETQQPKKYLQSAELSNSSTLEELNGVMEEFEFTVDPERYTVTVDHVYDSKSGDSLYYTLYYESIDHYCNVRMVAVCNEDYEFPFWLEEGTTTSLGDYTVTYTLWSNWLDQFGVNELRAEAKLEKGTETIYVDFTLFYDSGSPDDSVFFGTLQSMFQ